MAAQTFFNLYQHGFIRAAVCIPEIKVADVPFNTLKTLGTSEKSGIEKSNVGYLPGIRSFRLFQ